VVGEGRASVFSHGPSRWLANTAVVAAITAAASGCGGDQESTTFDGSTATAAQTTQQTDLRTRFDDQMRALLGERGLDPGVIECSLARLRATVSDRELEAAVQEIKQTGAPPPSMIAVAAEAGQQCAGE